MTDDKKKPEQTEYERFEEGMKKALSLTPQEVAEVKERVAKEYKAEKQKPKRKSK